MKSKILTLFSICLLFFLLLHPDEGLLGARDGLTLWLNVMLPTLLPFLIFTGILLKAGNLTKLLNPFSLLWEKCFGLSAAGAYVLILGFLCGYPMGAKIAHDLYINDQISKKEGEYLLSFSCNASPAFVVSYLTGSILQNRIHPMQIVLILLTADLFCMLFFRFLIYHGNTLTPAKVKSIKKETYQQDSTGVILDVSIMNGFEIITQLGGYIILFSILSGLLMDLHPFGSASPLLCGVLEITTGIAQLAASSLPYAGKVSAILTCAAFGGLSVAAQTNCMIHNSGLPLWPYLAGKLCCAAFAGTLGLFLFAFLF